MNHDAVDDTKIGLNLVRALFFLFAIFGVLWVTSSEQARAQAPNVPADVGKVSSDYRLGPGDKLKITVFGNQDVSGEAVIDPQGKVAVPLLGQVQAGGQTVADVQKTITEALNKDYIVDPKVTIEVLNYRPFFILGEVNKPGSYFYIAGLNLRQAVAIGGGYTRRARTSEALIHRIGGNGEETITANPETLILPGDTVDVPRRLF
jgi:protein involved in polysaccharide export with SLBB domain